MVIGQCIGDSFIGKPPQVEEKNCKNWLCSPIFANGLANNFIAIDKIANVATSILTRSKEKLKKLLPSFNTRHQHYIKLINNTTNRNQEEELFENNFFTYMTYYTGLESWDTADQDGQLIDIVVNCFLITVLHHTNLIDKSPDHILLKEVYKIALNLRHKLISVLCQINSRARKNISEDFEEDPFRHSEDLKYVVDDTSSELANEDFNFYIRCTYILERSLFILLSIERKY